MWKRQELWEEKENAICEEIKKRNENTIQRKKRAWQWREETYNCQAQSHKTGTRAVDGCTDHLGQLWRSPPWTWACRARGRLGQRMLRWPWTAVPLVWLQLWRQLGWIGPEAWEPGTAVLAGIVPRCLLEDVAAPPEAEVLELRWDGLRPGLCHRPWWGRANGPSQHGPRIRLSGDRPPTCPMSKCHK